MDTTPILLGRQVAKLLGEHPYLSSCISSVAAFLIGIFVKEPLERWWTNRGKLKQLRNTMYFALAEMFTEVEFFFRGLQRVSRNNPAIEQHEVTRLVDVFYEHILARDYREELAALRAVRTSIAGEVEGFERVMHYTAQLPGLKQPIERKFDGIVEFCNKFSMAMLTEAFDLQILTPIIAERRKTEVLRRLTVLDRDLALAVADTREKLSEINSNVNARRAADQQLLQETEPDETEVDLDHTRKLISRTREVLAQHKAARTSSAATGAA